MANLVLYRKYRPQVFSEIIGQEHIVKTLTNAISAGIISHAYLFCGPRGSGKTTIARLMAKSLNCEKRKDYEPCNNCSSCLEINQGKSLDLIEIDAASHRGIDEIRELREGIRYVPTKSKYKVFVIDECLTEDHLITLTDGGVKKISEIENGEKVASVDLKTGEIVEGEVKDWFKRETDQLIEINTPQTSLKCTLAHRLWILRDSKLFLVEARNLKIGDFLLSPIYLPHLQKNNLTLSQLSLLALIQCDGHISKDSITIQIEINKDKDYFKKIIEEGLKAWQIKEKLVIKKTSRGTRLIRIYSRKLKETLMNLDCPEGKKGKKIDIPDIIFHAPIESIKAYIDTCFCCEGNIDFNKSLNLYRLHFNSTSGNFVKKLQLLLKKFGISSSILKIKRKNERCFPQFRLALSHYNLKIFHQKIGLSLKRKAELLAKCSLGKEKQDPIPIEKIIIEKQQEIKLPYKLRSSLGIYPDLRQHLSRRAVMNFIKVGGVPELNKYLQFRYEMVKKIKILDKKKEVYDFTVEGTHTFIANGICSSNSHQLTKEAANALLKTLEEPPAHAIFILATTEIQKMISTIISRCQRFDFWRLTLPQILKRLEILSKKENLRIEKSALELIALNSGGSFRDAESLLDQVITFSGRDKEIKAEDIKNLLGIVGTPLVSQFVDFLIKKEAGQAITFLNGAFDRGLDPQEFSKALINYLRQVLITKINPDLSNPVLSGLTNEEDQKIKSQAENFQEPDLTRILNIFLDAENKMKYSSISQLPLELATIESCGIS